MARTSFIVEKHEVGRSAPIFLIAEAGVNHDGDLSRGMALVDAAAEAGASAVKFQTFRADRLASHDAPKARYQGRGTSEAESQHEMLRRLELTPEMHEKLLQHAHRRGLVFLSTPFDEASADFLAGLGLPAIKIPSGEITNLPFLKHVARLGKPVLLSTGMADLGEVEAAIETLEAGGAPAIALFHCTSVYPAPTKEVNLRAMGTLRAAFGYPVGYSDHTPGLEISIAAAALGARLIEKHLTLDRNAPGPDHAVSLEPKEWKELARAVRSVESALGSSRKRPTFSEREIARVSRKSLVTAVDLPKGAKLDVASLRALRPGTGFPPSELPHLVGRRLAVECPAGTLLRPEHLE